MQATDRSAARMNDLERLRASVREAGTLALKYFGKPVRNWIKNESSPVSEADIAVNDLLRERLLGNASEDGWLSEESENEPTRLSKRRVWVVDPIDGTRAYLSGREDWSVSAALVEDGRPVAAAIFAPVTEELFLAAAGAGAHRNSKHITVSAGGELEGARIAGPKRALDSMAHSAPRLVAVPRIHSLALRLVRVAQGELGAAIAGGNSHDWDLAAADLLVHEAGGLLTSLDGKPLTYNQPDPVHSVLVAAGRERHGRVLDLVRLQYAGAT